MSAIECDPSSSWWAFLTVAVGLYVLGLAASSFAALVLSRNALRGRLLCTSEAFTRLLSPNTLSGKLLTVFGLFCNSVYLSLALYYTTLPVERCVETTSSTLLLELFISSALVGLFVLRILSSARGPLQHWLSLLVVVDVFTLPHTFLVLLLSRDWLGLRTLRFLWLTEAANLFTIFSWCTISQDVLKVVKLVLRLVSIWLAMAGLVQMLEASGDPWDDSGLVQNLTYLESAYFIIVTMSTVGYGDIFPITVSGRVVVTVFILTGLAVYTTALPTLVNIAVMYYNTSQFTGNHSAIVSNQYVVVCGHVTAISAAGFLKELLHPDRHDTTTRIIFLHPDTPSTELRQVLKTNYTRVEYLIGSPLSTCDLHRCGLEKARACVVLADRFSNDPLAEDRANLLQVASLKNTSSSTLVILQLLCGCSKELLASIPCWSHHDVVICFYELKLKILAQSCLTPGFATLISNLFFVSSPHHLPLQNGLWKTLYTQGACKEIYSSILSPTFNGMRVPEVAQVCFREMGLLLIAVVNGQESGGFLQRSVIQNRATGYFIADTAHDVECVRYFCIRCRKKLCHCNLSPERTRQSCFTSSAQSISYAVSPMTSSHSCSTPLQQRNVEGLINHIVLCVFASADSTGIGLHNFLAPLASSCDVVIVCNATNYLNQEMMYISQYPRVHIIKGSPLEWNSLLRAGVQQSRLCVILTAPRHIRYAVCRWDRYDVITLV